MKKILLTILTFLNISFSFSQGQTIICNKKGGVFKTYNSFLQHQFSDSVCLDNKNNSIRQGGSDRAIIKSNGNKLIFKHGEIYAYFDGKSTYRYFKTIGAMSPKGYFKIEDTSGLVIYSQTNHSFRNYSIKFYYSKGLNDPIKLLNIKNLESDFNNVDFLNWIRELKNLNHKIGNTFIVNELYKKYIR